MPTTFAMGLAFLAGVALTVQIGINVHLRQGVGSAAIAAFISFLVGAAVLLVYAFIARLSWPSWSSLTQIPAWAWVGGVLGAFYVGSTIALSPRLGAALFVVLVVAGQLVAALVVDHYGWLSATAHPINAWRAAGVALVVAGVFLIQRH